MDFVSYSPPTFKSLGGGLVSTAKDFARYDSNTLVDACVYLHTRACMHACMMMHLDIDGHTPRHKVFTDARMHVSIDGHTHTAPFLLSFSPHHTTYTASFLTLPPSFNHTHSTPTQHRLAQMLLNGGRLDGVQVLSPRAVDLMWRNYLPKVTKDTACWFSGCLVHALVVVMVG